MADHYGPGGPDPQDGSQQNNTYHYNYSYGSGRGTTPPGGRRRPPRRSDDWGEWIGIGFLILVLPFWFCKLFGVIWLISKLNDMSAGEKRRYKQEAKNAAQRARNTAQAFFQQGADAARQAADSARQGADAARQAAESVRQQARGAASSASYSYQIGRASCRERV